jgi:DNA-binding NarL/FixJ family response regulator
MGHRTEAGARGARSLPAPHLSPGNRELRVFLADDHVLFRELLSELLAAESASYQIVGQAGTAKGAIDACRTLKPDLLILDINLPGQSGVDAMPELKRLCPDTRVLLCSGSVNEQQIVTALRTSVDGFMEKTSDRQEFLAAVARVSAGENYFCARSSRLLSEVARGLHPNSGDAPDISGREKEILTLIANGRTSKEIASALFISIFTVDTHRRNLMAKIGARNTAGVIRYALAHGLLRVPDQVG